MLTREFSDDIRGAEYFSFKVGDRIKHADFGPGKIVGISGSDEMLKVTVLFADGSMRKLLAKYANLELI